MSLARMLWNKGGSSKDDTDPPKPQYPAPPADGRCIINELPPELFNYIFDFAVQIQLEDPDYLDSDSDSDSGDSEPRPVPVAVLVSHVCKLWRSVALNQPTLWNHIALDITATPEGIQRAKTRLATYLERAREAPLDIAIDLGDFPEDSDSEEDDTSDDEKEARPEYKYLSEMIDMVVPRHKQLRSFEVIVSDFLLMAATLKVLEEIPEAPQLESLSLYNHDEFDDMEFFEPTRFTNLHVLPFHGKAPRLKSVALWGVHLDWEQTSLTLLKDLEELELAYHPEDVRPTYKQYARILSQCPNLKMLALCHSGPRGDMVEWSENVNADIPSDQSHVEVPSINLPSLASLVLSFEDKQEYLQNLIDHLNMPNVTELTLDLSAQDDTDFFRKISTAPPGGKSLLHGITRFKLTDCSCNTAVVHQALLSMQNVESLNLNFHYLDNCWVDLLRGDSEEIKSPKIPCPKLEEVMLRGLTGKQAVELAQRRKEAAMPLTKIWLEESDYVREEDQLRLKQLVEVEYFEGSDTEVDDESDEYYLGLGDEELFEIDSSDGASLASEDIEDDDGNTDWTDDTSGFEV